MLSFLYPAFLIGAAAVAIPLILHLLRNQEAPELRFSAVRLLRGVRVEHTQRRRIRDWLLLALRATALLMLALAFARPYLPVRHAVTGRAAVILLDRSASMAPEIVWRRARAAALAAVDRAAPGESLALVAFDDRPELVAGPTLDRGAIRAAIDAVKPAAGATRYQPAFSRAVAVLDEANDSGGRIVLVSDLQGTSADARGTLPESVQLELSGVAADLSNVSILAARRTAEGIAVTVRNDGASSRNLRVVLEDGGRRVAETRFDLGATQSLESTITARAAQGRLRVALAEPDSSGMIADDARYLDATGGVRLRVLVISGKAESFYLGAALRAGGEQGLEVSEVRAQEAAVALARDPRPDVLFVIGARGLDRGGRDALVRFVRDGGGVFIGSPDGIDEAAFAAVVEGMDVTAPRGDDAVLTLAAVDGRHPLFKALASMNGPLSAARFTRTWHVRAPGWQTLATFDDGSGAVFERTLGRGRIVVFASDLNRDWNDLPLQTAFVPFVQEAATYLAPQGNPREYTPGTLPPGGPSGLGFVRLASGRTVVVNADPRESDPARMNASQFAAAVTHRGSRRVDPEGATRRARAAEQGQGLWRYGLMIMFGTLVAEGIVGARRRT